MDRICVTSQDVCRIIGIGIRDLDRWVRLGAIRPMRVGGGPGSHHSFDLLDVVAVAVCRHLRQRGFSLPVAGAALRWFQAQTIEGLRAEWKRKRVYLLIVGENCFPRLISRRECIGNPDVDLFGAHAAGVPVALLDLEEITDKVQAKLTEEIAVGAGT